MEPFLISAGAVAIAEIGDKTQLLALLLAARFRRPWPIILGILVATLANHALAAGIGVAAAAWLHGPVFRGLVGVGFLVMAAWALIPDTPDDELPTRAVGGVFLTTLVAFFLVEIGDKTQIATTLLGARYRDVVQVAAGTTLGMMIANVPAVLLGERVTRIVPLRYVRRAAAALFAVVGIAVLIGLLAR